MAEKTGITKKQIAVKEPDLKQMFNKAMKGMKKITETVGNAVVDGAIAMEQKVDDYIQTLPLAQQEMQQQTIQETQPPIDLVKQNPEPTPQVQTNADLIVGDVPSATTVPNIDQIISELEQKKKELSNFLDKIINDLENSKKTNAKETQNVDFNKEQFFNEFLGENNSQPVQNIQSIEQPIGPQPNVQAPVAPQPVIEQPVQSVPVQPQPMPQQPIQNQQPQEQFASDVNIFDQPMTM